MGLIFSKREAINDDKIVEDFDIIDNIETNIVKEENSENSENTENTEYINKIASEIVTNIIEDVQKTLDNDNLCYFRTWVLLDSKNIEIQNRCIKDINKNLFKNINRSEFVNIFNKYYDNLGTLGKTAYEVCKSRFTIEEFHALHIH